MPIPTSIRIVTLPPNHPAKFIEHKFTQITLPVATVAEQTGPDAQTIYVVHILFADLLEALRRERLFATVDWCRTHKRQLRVPTTSYVALHSNFVQVVDGRSCHTAPSSPA